MAGRSGDHVDELVAQWARERPDLELGAMATFGRLGRYHAQATKAIEQVFTDHGLGLGETAEVLHLGGRTYRNDGVVLAVDPGRRLEWRTTTGADAEGSRSVRPVGEAACEVALELRVRYHGAQRLLAPVLSRMLRRGLHADLAALRDLASRAWVS